MIQIIKLISIHFNPWWQLKQLVYNTAVDNIEILLQRIIESRQQMRIIVSNSERVKTEWCLHASIRVEAKVINFCRQVNNWYNTKTAIPETKSYWTYVYLNVFFILVCRIYQWSYAIYIKFLHIALVYKNTTYIFLIILWRRIVFEQVCTVKRQVAVVILLGGWKIDKQRTAVISATGKEF